MLSITAYAGTVNVSGLRILRDLENLGAVISSSSDRERVSPNDFPPLVSIPDNESTESNVKPPSAFMISHCYLLDDVDSVILRVDYGDRAYFSSLFSCVSAFSLFACACFSDCPTLICLSFLISYCLHIH